MDKPSPSPLYQPEPKILSLGDGYWDAVKPADFPERHLRFRNDRAAESVGLADMSPSEWESAFARFAPLDKNLPEPLALRYHGHQFGVYNPHLGDGRGFLFAQLRDDRGRLLDLATKGSGTTPWSRGGDGRLTLKGGVREVLAAEMLEALGVPTSRAFSLFETGESLYRGDEPSPTRSSVLVRLGHSHVRFGTFQRLARERDAARITKLVDFCVEAYFPDLVSADDRVLAMFERTTEASIRLVAAWMAAGFCHGVLNTDNMTITGESFDYGPWRFVPHFDPEFVSAYFDHGGLYAFGRQPAAVKWNLERLGDALRVASPSAPFGHAIATFDERYAEALARATVRRLGLASSPDLDRAFSEAVWQHLRTTKTPFERFFFDAFGGGKPPPPLARLFEAYAPLPIVNDREGPATMLIDEVEAIWANIAYADDWTAFAEKVIDVRDYGSSFA